MILTTSPVRRYRAPSRATRHTRVSYNGYLVIRKLRVRRFSVSSNRAQTTTRGTPNDDYLTWPDLGNFVLLRNSIWHGAIPVSTKKAATRIIFGGVVAIALAYYALLLFGCWANDTHVQGAAARNMIFVYEDLYKYHERNGRWPQNLMEAAKQQGSSSSHFIRGGDIVDLVSHRPLLYYPDAKPGTHAILLAQPEPNKIGLWPFITMRREGIRADGKLVDVQGDEREVDDSENKAGPPGRC